jgi:hypothetical protein
MMMARQLDFERVKRLRIVGFQNQPLVGYVVFFY